MQSLTCRPSRVEPITTTLVVGAAALGRLASLLPEGHCALVVADAALAGSELLALATAGAADIALVEGGESAKRVGRVAELWDRWLAAGAGRDSVVIALGGGVISDVAGFAAATFLRGVPWIVAPTTILAMADAAIGGKTGINVNAGKNLAGAVHHPLAIVADLDALASLPDDAYRDGWAEVVKAGVIGNEALLVECEEQAAAVGARDLGVVERLLVAAMRVKIDVVEADSVERSRREILNFGHTAAHALERALPGISHGRAVAIGMGAEARIAEGLDRLPTGTSDRIIAACVALGIDTRLPSFDESAFVAALAVDKKRRAGRLRVALPARLGEHSEEPGVAINPVELVEALHRVSGS